MASHEACLREASSRFTYPDVARFDIEICIEEYSELIPKIDTMYSMDKHRASFCLIGTIPVTYKGCQYDTPVCIWLLDSYPYYPPMIRVQQTEAILLNGGHYISRAGLVTFQYLHDWKPQRSNLLDMMYFLTIVLAEEPPVIIKRKSDFVGKLTKNSSDLLYDYENRSETNLYASSSGRRLSDLSLRRQAFLRDHAPLWLWIELPSGKEWSAVPLSVQSEEYRQVASRFTPGKIKSIARIQNPQQYKLYEAMKLEMDKANGSLQNEQRLYHGTVAESLDNILHHGFNRSYCGVNATVLGDGVYFAVDPKYAAKKMFSRPAADGTKHIIQCKVLQGKSCDGKPGMKEPPHISGTSGPRYNSVTGYEGSHVVIFKDAQAYPEYLIKFSD